MTIAVVMPQGGQDIESGTLVQWLKKEGDPVSKGEVICEVETEKVVLEVEAPVDGFLRKIVAREGAEVPILSVIGIIGALDEVVNLDAIQPQVRTEEYTETVEHAERDVARIPGKAKIRISPRAKKLALEKGIPFHLTKGSGPGGRVTEKDVLEYLAGQPAEEAPSSAGQTMGGRAVPMTKSRKVIARKMQLSKQTIPHFYVSISVDMTDALELQRELNEGVERTDEAYWSLTDLITMACVVSLKEVPELNCSLADQGNIMLWENVNIGIAVAMDTGILVPVLENADQMTLRQIAHQTRRLVALARDGKVSSLSPSRFTISNLGMFNIDNFIAIINPPETAILAIASIGKRVVAVEGDRIVVRDMMSMTLSIDHRVADGVVASRFVNKVKSLLEEPRSLV